MARGKLIKSCVISQSLAGRWLAFEGNLEAPHADFPSWIYVREVNDNYDAWRAPWSYGVIHEPGTVLDVAYAVDHLAIEEPWYVRVSRPSPQFGQSLDLERMPWGYQFKNRETGGVIWSNRCSDNNQLRVLASKRWMLETLARHGLLWAFDVRIAKERREKGRWGYSLAEQLVWVVRALIDEHGQVTWGSTERSQQAFDPHWV